MNSNEIEENPRKITGNQRKSHKFKGNQWKSKEMLGNRRYGG